MKNAIIVDDERLARRRLRRLLERSGSVRVLKECRNGAEAVEVLRKEPADVVFLDVQMPGLDGFEVIATVGADAMPAVVFVTAYEEYAIRAFEANALDYLVKPIEEARLGRTIARLDRPGDLWRRLAALLEERRSRKSPFRFLVKQTSRLVIIPAGDVDFIRSEGNYVRLHAGTCRYLLRETMERLAQRLDDRFVRIHRSILVRTDGIRELVPSRGGEVEVKLDSGQRLPVSRRYRSSLNRVLSL
jgi:two-component system LytT family response regulator